MDLWNKEKHHAVLLEYTKLKHSLYSSKIKLFTKHLTNADIRSLNKVIDEIIQNIQEYQIENEYYLTLYTKQPSKPESKSTAN